MAERVGLSKSISLDLLNEVYEQFISDLSKAESKEKLDAIIGATIGSKDTIRKTRSILQSLWYGEDDWFRHEAALAARYMTHAGRLPVHWAMLMDCYPLFTDICVVLGQLFEIKDSVSSAQIKAAIYDKWGPRSTLEACLSKNLKSLRDMGALVCGDSRTYCAKVTYTVQDPKAAAILLAAVLRATGQRCITWESFITHPAIFPFAIDSVTQADIAPIPYLSMERMGTQVVLRIAQSASLPFTR